MFDVLWFADSNFYAAWLTAYAEAKAGVVQPTRTKAPADITVHGLLLPSVPDWFGMVGITATSYESIIEQARAAMTKRGDTVYMSIDSGGGSVKGIDGAIAALRELSTQKRIVAYVDGMAASAAYWLAVQATEIHATAMSEVGGIGAYSALPPGSKDVKVIRSAPHKGAGIDGWTDEQVEATQDIIDRLGNWFLQDVARNRPETNLSDIGSGRVWLAEQAAQLKLIDGVTEPGALSAKQMENKKMSDELTERLAKAEADLKAAQERETYRASMLAAFPDDPAFALAQIEAGKTLVEAQAEQIRLLKAASAQAATPVIPAGSAGEVTTQAATAQPKTFMQAVEEYRTAHNCDYRTAAHAVDSGNPELRIKHLAAIVAKGSKGE